MKFWHFAALASLVAGISSALEFAAAVWGPTDLNIVFFSIGCFGSWVALGWAVIAASEWRRRS